MIAGGVKKQGLSKYYHSTSASKSARGGQTSYLLYWDSTTIVCTVASEEA